MLTVIPTIRRATFLDEETAPERFYYAVHGISFLDSAGPASMPARFESVSTLVKTTDRGDNGATDLSRKQAA